MGFVHEALLELDAGCDPAAPGGAVTVALCGSWDHHGPCHWPHHNDIDDTAASARFRTVFVAPAEDGDEVTDRIRAALTRPGTGWQVVSDRRRDLTVEEQEQASRLAAGPDD